MEKQILNWFRKLSGKKEIVANFLEYDCRGTGIFWLNEDELPDMPKDVYHAMFELSFVNIVRYFPYIKGNDGKRYYLVDLDKTR